MKRIITPLILVSVLLLFASCSKKSTAVVAATTQPVTEITTLQPTTEIATTVAATQAQQTKAAAAQTEAQSEADNASTSKVTDMVFTMSSSNKFIKTVSEKYNVDPSLLACLYSKTGGDKNYVWQFDGTTDSSGKILRNADTLKYVYGLSADCSSVIYTNGSDVNVGCSDVNGVFAFEAAKDMLVPKFESELNP